MKIHDDDLLLIMRALFWYDDRVTNQQQTQETLIEGENIDFLRQNITEYIKQRAYLA